MLRASNAALFPYTTLFRSVQALGGAKNHVIVMPDADLDRAVANISESLFGCAGQRCLAGSVVVAAGKAYEPFRERLLRSEEHTSELQSHSDLVCRLRLEKK